MTNTALSVIPNEDEHKGELSTVEEQGAKLGNASWMATELKKIIEANGLAIDCGGKKKHLELEAWTTVARIQNEQPHSKYVRSFDDRKGFEVIEAHAWVTDASGTIVSEADSFVSTEEKRWANAPFYARASMAQTRAMGKALKLRHSWIMVMAGYSPTPADEMQDLGAVETRPPKQTRKKAPQREQAAPMPKDASVSHPQDPASAAPDGSGEPINDATAQADEDLKQVVGKILRVSEKPGKRQDGSTYTRYGVEVEMKEGGKRWFNTFSGTLGKVSKELTGSEQTIVYSISQWNGQDTYDLEEYVR